ncbi:MAG TPA: hypothetical protein VLX28_10380 [Thermoanaerobaculia bacterium]|nr:hypothetical protein [Thermoanaerobaculia bacterium]
MNRRKALGVMIVCAVLCAASPSYAQPKPEFGRLLDALKHPIAEAMVRTAERTGVAVNPLSLTQGWGNGATVVAGTISGLESVPATDLPKGVNTAFVYLDLPDGPGGVQPNLPAGFYTVRVTASLQTVQDALKASGGVPPDTTNPGASPTVPGAKIELVNAHGQVAAVVPAQLEAFSLTAPTNVPKQRTVVEPVFNKSSIIVWIICLTNGWAVKLEMSWFDFVSSL